LSLYARSDVCAISVPLPAGCGATHTRPVTHGAPAKVFKLECEPCEAFLRGDHRPKILKYDLDPKTRTVIGQSRVADADPMWSSTPDTTPLTPDEERTNSVRTERGAQQIQMIQALAALRATGIEVPPEALWLLERELPAGVLKGVVVCVNGHDVPSGNQFCGSCGASMSVRAAVGGGAENPPGEPEVDLERLHPQTLKKMCRERKLPDGGSKDALVRRLRAA
jgi:hypothetical protein